MKDYDLEEILERCELEPVDALELLVTYGAIDPDDLEAIIDGTDIDA